MINLLFWSPHLSFVILAHFHTLLLEYTNKDSLAACGIVSCIISQLVSVSVALYILSLYLPLSIMKFLSSPISYIHTFPGECFSQYLYNGRSVPRGMVFYGHISSAYLFSFQSQVLFSFLCTPQNITKPLFWLLYPQIKPFIQSGGTLPHI